MSRLPDRLGGGWQALVGAGRRSERSVAGVVAALLAVVAVAAVAAPRLLTRAEASSLERAIENAPPSDRRLTIRVIEEFGRGAADDPLGEQRALLDTIVEGIDESVLSRYGEPRLVADSSRFQVVGVGAAETQGGAPRVPPREPTLPSFVTFRVHPDLDEHSRLVAGREAADTEREMDGVPVVEFEMTPTSAEELDWELGETIALSTDPTDLVTRQFNGGLPDDFVAELVGLRELDPADDPYWFGDERLHRPTVADTGTGANVFAFATLHQHQLPTRPFTVGGRSPFALEQRRDLIDGAVDLETAQATLDGLTALDASFARQPTLTRPGVAAGLGQVLAIERDQRRAARTTLVLAAVGVLGVVLTTLAQLLVASAGRRRGWLTVARARGASRGQVVTGAAAEMAVIATLAVALGAAGAVAVLGGDRSGLETSLLVALWSGSIAAAALLALSEGFRPLTVSARPSAHPGLGRWGRVGGAVLVVVAAAALVTFRRRGLATDSPDIDTLVVLVPVLVPLAIVYASRWLLPALLRQVARRGMALGPGRLVGLRRAADQPDASVGVTTVLVLALTVAALGLGVNRSLERGAVDASWAAVGAPYRIDTRERAVGDAVASIPGSVVSASGSTRINVDRGDSTFNIQFVTVDVPEIRALTGGSSADETYPEELDRLDLSGRVPVVASERMGGQLVRSGDVLVGLGTRQGQEFLVVETRGEAFGRRTDWILADRSVYAGVAGVEPGFNTLAIGVPGGARDRLETIAAASGEEVAARLDVLAVQRDDPLSRAVRAGYLVAALLAVLLALLALVAIAVVTARERRREVAILGLLGSGRQEISRAVASELVPAALAGVAVGTVVGWLVVIVFDGRYDLSSFAAGSPVSIRPDRLAAVLVAVAVAAAAVAVIVGLIRRIVRAPVGEILRIDGAA